MSIPIEAEDRVSEELSAFIRAIANDPDIDEAVTLGLVRDKLRESLGEPEAETARRDFGSEQSLYVEIEALIEEYGEDVLATDFASIKASDDLSTLIEALVDNCDEETVPTLRSVRQAIDDGWVARLAGDGILDADQEQTLLAELESLIQRYGDDTPAEELLRFE